MHSLKVEDIRSACGLTSAAIRRRISYAKEGSVSKRRQGVQGELFHPLADTVARLRQTGRRSLTLDQIEELAVIDVEYRARQVEKSHNVGDDAVARAAYVIGALTPEERARFDVFRRKMVTSLVATFWQQAVFSQVLEYLDISILHADVFSHVVLGTRAPEVENGFSVAFVLSNLLEGSTNPFLANAA